MSIISDNLRFLRKKKGLNQDEMLDSTGISGTTWSDYERAKTEPSYKALIKISEFFDVSVDELIKDNLQEKELKGNLIRKNSESEKSNLNSNANSNLLGEKPESQGIDAYLTTDAGQILLLQAKYTNLLEKYNQVLEGKLIENEFRYKFEDVQATLLALQELILHGELNTMASYAEKTAALGKKKHEALVELGIVVGDSR